MEHEYFRYRVKDKQCALKLFEKVHEQTQLCRKEPTEQNFEVLEDLLHDLYGAIISI